MKSCRRRWKRPWSRPLRAAAASLSRWTAVSKSSAIKIDPEAVKADDLEMLQDLIAAAVNGASKKIDDAMQSSMGGMLGGMGIPGL